MSGIDIAFSGCTLNSIVLFDNTIFSINIGDSRCFLCQGITCTSLSTMHKPDDPI
jgi:serine/threonine protein phosphatase PrpC